MTSLSRSFALALTCIPLLAACNPSEPCIETLELIDFKDDTVFGLTASEAVARLGLPFEGPMGYFDENTAASEIRGLLVQASIAAAYAEGEVRFFDREVNPGYNPRGMEDLAAPFGEQCPDRIEVDLATSFTTDDGRFAEENLPGVMTIMRDPWAVEGGQADRVQIDFRVELPVDELQGTFSRELVQEDLSRLILAWTAPAPDSEPVEGEGPATGTGSLDIETSGGSGNEGWVGYGGLAWIGQNPAEDEN